MISTSDDEFVTPPEKRAAVRRWNVENRDRKRENDRRYRETHKEKKRENLEAHS